MQQRLDFFQFPGNLRAFTVGFEIRRFRTTQSRLTHVGHVQKRAALQSDIDESRLHAWQHPQHPALVKAPHDTQMRGPFDQDFLQYTVLQQGDASFLRRDIDENLFVHDHRLAAVLAPTSSGWTQGKTGTEKDCSKRAVSRKGNPMMPE